MGPGSVPRGSLTEIYGHSGLGCLFAAGVIAFMAGGWLLDRVLGTFPVLTVIGALVGAALSTASIYRRLQGGNDKDSSSSEDT